jgi:hypothetical protein
MTRKCFHCGCEVLRRHKSCLMCYPCSSEHARIRQSASSKLLRAVKAGKVPRAVGQTCVDCGKPATRYDHRDYSRPLHVVPVCASCNQLRGPAIWGRPCLDVARVAA